jgi:sugar phosphate permease
MHMQRKELPPTARAYSYLFTLTAAYIGVYLCRKNLTVAVPLLQSGWGLDKERVGIIGSVSTVAYAAGKFLFGPITDRLGGRRALVASMVLTAGFGAACAWSPSLLALTILYSVSRLFGSASWGAMLKLLPEWFAPARLPFTCGVLSLSFVFGGAFGVSFGGLVGRLTHDSWQAILLVPALVLVCLAVAVLLVLPRSSSTTATKDSTRTSGFNYSQIWPLFRERQFAVVVALSFTLTLLRETFNFWTVDFIRTEAGANLSNSVAAFLSTPFDLCGGAGIVLMGWAFGKLDHAGRRRLVVGVLLGLAVLLAGLPVLFHAGIWLLAAGLGLIGFLVYGPYSLLGGVLSVEVRGKEYAATVSGVVDGTGYIAGFLSGMFFGRLLMAGGYRLGFEVMAGLTLLAACVSCRLYVQPKPKAHTLSETAPSALTSAQE